MNSSTSPTYQHFHTSSTTTTKKRRRTTRHRTTVRSETDYTSSSSNTATQSDGQDYSPNIFTSGEDDIAANCLILLSRGGDRTINAVGVYECKTCNRVFHSFQALGGHRASHKKKTINSMIAVRSTPPPSSSHDDDDETDGQDESMKINMNVVRMHECSICGSEFSSGQALGGHMRRHRPPQLPTPTNINRPIEVESSTSRNILPLDLNLPAPHDDDEISLFHDHVLTSTPALVDCHY